MEALGGTLISLSGPPGTSLVWAPTEGNRTNSFSKSLLNKPTICRISEASAASRLISVMLGRVMDILAMITPVHSLH